MSDEFILERAKAIQDALIEMRTASPPAAVLAKYTHPTRQFAVCCAYVCVQVHIIVGVLIVLFLGAPHKPGGIGRVHANNC